MARVIITCTCARCGKKFEHIHMCRNSAEAASYKSWAAENIDICPACHSAEKQAKESGQLANYVASFGSDHQLPEITGVSAKQISYADDLRNSFIKNELLRFNVNIPRFFMMASAIRLDRLSDNGLSSARAAAEKDGKSLKDWFAAYRLEKLKRDAHLPTATTAEKIEKVFATGNASEIINILR